MTDLLIPASAIAGLLLQVVLVVYMVRQNRQIDTLARARDAGAEAADLATADLKARFEMLQNRGATLDQAVRQDLALARTEHASAAGAARAELAGSLAQFGQLMREQLAAMATGQGSELKSFADRLAELAHSNEVRLEAVRATIEQRLDMLRAENAQKLDEMRLLVDEKLQSTLDARLGASFKQVSDRLEQVHKGLGEMQSLAAGVGDLKRVLSNVKNRGGWGEVQLGALLSELLTPAQFAQNVATRPGSREHVEYAVKFPGRGDDGAPCWLPIDAKFPLEDYQRLQDAVERADVAGVEASRKALDAFFRREAKAIHDKYVEPPHTTDFAILFVPTEGLYAEAVSRAGLADALQREHRVMLAGPMNLAAMLNSLQMGFRTLAIEKRSTEVWRVLGQVKTEFARFGDVLSKTRKKLDEARDTIDAADVRTRAIERSLRHVEASPEAESLRLVGGDRGAIIDARVQPDDESAVEAANPPVALP